MRRRALLTSLVAGTAGIAGCSGLTGGGDTTPTTDDEPTVTDTLTDRPPATTTDESDERTTTPPEEQPPEGFASVVDLETGPRTYAFRATQFYTDDEAQVVLWFDRTATADHPARLRGWVENRNDFENTFRIEWIPAVGRVHARQPQGYDHEARLHLAPTENNALASTVPEVVRDESGYWRVADVGPWMAETYRMEPGERQPLEYELVGEPGMPGRPTGTYEFRGDGETASVTVWDSTSPGPEADARFAGRDLPAIGSGDVQWYHEADDGTVAYVRPGAERVELNGSVDFEMVNNSRESLGCGHWNLHKLVDGEWFHVGPMVHTADCRNLPPGGREEWSLRAFNGESVDCGCPTGLTRGYLGGGEYAVVAGYGHPADQSAALVELVGEGVTLSLTEDATVQREGDTVTVSTDHYGDGEHPPDATATLTRADSAEERVIAEQVMGSDGFAGPGRALRNALAVMGPEVESVVVRTDAHAVSDGTTRFRFRGQAYEIQSESV